MACRLQKGEMNIKLEGETYSNFYGEIRAVQQHDVTVKNILVVFPWKPPAPLGPPTSNFLVRPTFHFPTAEEPQHFACNLQLRFVKNLILVSYGSSLGPGSASTFSRQSCVWGWSFSYRCHHFLTLAGLWLLSCRLVAAVVAGGWLTTDWLVRAVVVQAGGGR